MITGESLGIYITTPILTAPNPSDPCFNVPGRLDLFDLQDGIDNNKGILDLIVIEINCYEPWDGLAKS